MLRTRPSPPSWPEQAAGTGGRAGRAGDEGPHSSLQYTHTVQYHSNDVCPSVHLPQGEARPTHPHAGPARPSDTREIRDEVGGHARLLVNHVGGAPRCVGVQQAVHGAKPAEERSHAERGAAAAPQRPGLGPTGSPLLTWMGPPPRRRLPSCGWSCACFRTCRSLMSPGGRKHRAGQEANTATRIKQERGGGCKIHPISQSLRSHSVSTTMD